MEFTSEEKSDLEGHINCGTYLKSKTIDKLELFFFRYGVLVGRYPWRFIIGSVCVTLICCLGLLKFHQEKHPMKLWIPPESDFARDTEWIMTEFGEGYRVQTLLVTAPDVLQPGVLEKVLEIREKVVASRLDNITFADVCFRIPVIDVNLRKRRRRSLNDLDEDGGGFFDSFTSSLFRFDPSVHLNTKMFCSLVESFPKACYERSLLEFWNYDEEVIKKLKKDDIIDMLNKTTQSPVYGLDMEYTTLLGGIERNASGVIVSARSLLSTWMVHINFSEVNMDQIGNSGGTADYATGPGMVWEKSFADTMEDITSRKYDDFKVYYEAARSFGDLSSALMFQDIDKVMIGVLLMFCYVLYVLSTCNWYELRLLPTGGGLACVGLAFISACGICSALGISYGPVHTSLPFLLMGIGVDDMFVIMACKNHLSSEEKKNNLPVQIGLTLRRAGISIAITSLTDIIATAIGGRTILPALESFCYFASAGVFMTFVYQSTFFLAFVVLDERRLADSRNAVFPWIKMQKKEPVQYRDNESIPRKFLHWFFSKVLLTKAGKVIVVFITCIITVICAMGMVNLRQKFDPKWFLPQDSQLVTFYKIRDEMYPYLGQDARIYFGKLNYSADIANIDILVKRLQSEEDIIINLESWCDNFFHYVNYYYNRDLPNEILSEKDWSIFIGKYLFSPDGAKYMWNFRFAKDLKCGLPAPPVTIASFDFKFKLFTEPEQALYAMNRVKDLLKASNITSGNGFKTVWARIFAHWVTDEVIQEEMYRNLALACACVMATTTIMILNIHTCFWIFVSVLLTLIDVCGTMYYWGLTVDIVSCIALVIAVGLCVDYAAHIGHTFLKCHGSRNERTMQTIRSVGSAVINGGFSTLIALSLLSLSQAYVFQSFFKIFLLVVMFGLFHGVIFLPVVLSTIGPDAPAATTVTIPVLNEQTERFIKSKQLKLEAVDS